jgi:hypothetical protein
MASVHEGGELDLLWPAPVHDGVECGANGSAGVKNVVDQEDALSVDLDCGANRLVGLAIVSKSGYVELRRCDGRSDLRFDGRSQRLPQCPSSGSQAEDYQAVDAPVALDHLSGEPVNRAACDVRREKRAGHGRERIEWSKINGDAGR